MGIESYLHKYSKIVMCAWLRKKIKIGTTKFKGLNNIPLDLKSPKKGPMFNVYPEYPVCKNKGPNVEDTSVIGLNVMWDEWLTNNNLNDKVKSKSRIPTVYELKDLSDIVEVITIFDIGVVDDGKLKYIFEIEHTHACTPRKIKFINEHELIGYEISAQKVIEQVKLPYCIDINREWNVKKVKSDDEY